ncbi:MAG TPA: hypothetical protein PK225_15860, partial [Azonexus sp.]|nr:hypothetical protein [Azonexus sp.]
AGLSRKRCLNPRLSARVSRLFRGRRVDVDDRAEDAKAEAEHQRIVAEQRAEVERQRHVRLSPCRSGAGLL